MRRPRAPQFEPMMKELRRLFDAIIGGCGQHGVTGTRVYAGKLDYDRKSA